LQPFAPFDEQEKHAGAKAEQHDGNAAGDAPKRAGGRVNFAEILLSRLAKNVFRRKLLKTNITITRPMEGT